MDLVRGEDRPGQDSELAKVQPILPNPADPTESTPEAAHLDHEFLQLLGQLKKWHQVSSKLAGLAEPFTQSSASRLKIKWTEEEQNEKVDCDDLAAYESEMENCLKEATESKEAFDQALAELTAQIEILKSAQADTLADLQALFVQATVVTTLAEQVALADKKNSMAYSKGFQLEDTFRSHRAEELGIDQAPISVMIEYHRVLNQIHTLKRKKLGFGRFSHKKEIEDLQRKLEKIDAIQEAGRKFHPVLNMSVTIPYEIDHGLNHFSGIVTNKMAGCYLGEAAKYDPKAEGQFANLGTIISYKNKAAILEDARNVTFESGQKVHGLSRVMGEKLQALQQEMEAAKAEVNLENWSTIRSEAQESGELTEEELDEVEFNLVRDVIFGKNGFSKDFTSQTIRSLDSARSEEVTALKFAMLYIAGGWNSREIGLRAVNEDLASQPRLGLPVVKRAAEFIKTHQRFCNPEIPNPEFEAWKAELKRDEEFLAEASKTLSFNKINMDKAVVTNDAAENGVSYDWATKTIYYNADFLRGILPGEEINFGEFNWEDEYNQRIVSAMTADFIKRMPLKIEYSSNRLHSGERVGTDRERAYNHTTNRTEEYQTITVEADFFWQIAEKYGHTRGNLPQRVANPENSEFEKIVSQLVKYLLERQDQPDLQLSAANALCRYMRNAQELDMIMECASKIDNAIVRDEISNQILFQVSTTPATARYLAENMDKAKSIVFDKRTAIIFCEHLSSIEELNWQDIDPEAGKHLAELCGVEVEMLQHAFYVSKKLKSSPKLSLYRGGYSPDSGNLGLYLHYASDGNSDYINATNQFIDRISSSETADKIDLRPSFFDFIKTHPEEVDLLVAIVTHPMVKGQASSLDVLLKTLGNYEELPKDKSEDYLEVFIQMCFSPSQEMQRIQKQLIEQIMQSPDPRASYRKIEEIFIRNNLPVMGKVYKIFETLHPIGNILVTLQNGILSPILQKAGDIDRRNPERANTVMGIFYADLLKIHIKSGNRSLREYINLLKNGQEAVNILDQKGTDNLNDQEQRLVRHFFAMAKTLQSAQTVGYEAHGENPDMDGLDLSIELRSIRSSLGVAEGDTIKHRLEELFLKPSGCDTFEEVLEAMDQSKKDAEMRNRKNLEGRELRLPAGSIVKGIDSNYFEIIMQNGSVAKEFLGSGSGSDGTPFDTDTAKLKSGTKLEKAFEESYAEGYGNMAIVVKNRDQFVETSQEGQSKYAPDKYEIFYSGVVGEKHYGIRTGFPSTEIDFIIATDRIASDASHMRTISFTIAQNGFYIPVVNTAGEVLFTTQMYDDLRKSFAGLKKYDGPDFSFNANYSTSRIKKDVEKVQQDSKADRESVLAISGQIRETISATLKDFGIELKDDFDQGLYGAELHDTGSTGRGTNLPENYDFDYVLRLDNDLSHRDFEQSTAIANALAMKFGYQEQSSHGDRAGGYQLRLMGASIGKEKVDIDIALVLKSELQLYGSHDAVSDRLTWIKENISPEASEQAVANILLAKELLKTGGAYKKQENGGLGGIGVENWILLNNGNIETAFRSFWDASHNKGKVLSLNDFQKNYSILDPGTNAKFDNHDNFVNILTSEGYQAMLRVIGDYLHLN